MAPPRSYVDMSADSCVIATDGNNGRYPVKEWYQPGILPQKQRRCYVTFPATSTDGGETPRTAQVQSNSKYKVTALQGMQGSRTKEPPRPPHARLHMQAKLSPPTVLSPDALLNRSS
jgi:hypothetical protein